MGLLRIDLLLKDFDPTSVSSETDKAENHIEDYKEEGDYTDD